jgi:hypothetical protein
MVMNAAVMGGIECAMGQGLFGTEREDFNLERIQYTGVSDVQPVP